MFLGLGDSGWQLVSLVFPDDCEAPFSLRILVEPTRALWPTVPARGSPG